MIWYRIWQSDAKWLVRLDHKRNSCAWLSLSWIICSWGIQLPCHEGIQAICGENHMGRNWSLPPAASTITPVLWWLVWAIYHIQPLRHPDRETEVLSHMLSLSLSLSLSLCVCVCVCRERRKRLIDWLIDFRVTVHNYWDCQNLQGELGHNRDQGKVDITVYIWNSAAEFPVFRGSQSFMPFRPSAHPYYNGLPYSESTNLNVSLQNKIWQNT
jgi:hypothetical protein